MHYKGMVFDKVAFPQYYIFSFKSNPDFELSPVLLSDGSLMRPGDKFKSIGGHKTSAGFTNIDMIGDAFLIYLGAVSSLDGRALCFATNEQPDGIKHEDHPFYFFGWLTLGCGQDWFHSTPAVSGRILETSRIVRVD